MGGPEGAGAPGERNLPSPRRYPGKPAIVQADKAAALLSKIERSWPASGPGLRDGIAWRMFKKNRVQDCDADELRRIVAALNYDARRHDREYP